MNKEEMSVVVFVQQRSRHPRYVHALDLSVKNSFACLRNCFARLVCLAATLSGYGQYLFLFKIINQVGVKPLMITSPILFTIKTRRFRRAQFNLAPNII